MKKILIIDNGNKEFKREIIQPFLSLLPSETFYIDILNNFISFSDLMDKSINYDYIIFQRCLFGDYALTTVFLRKLQELKEINEQNGYENIYPQTIYYINDYWNLPSYHLLHKPYTQNDIGNKIQNILRLTDFTITYNYDLYHEIKYGNMGMGKTILFENFYIPENITLDKNTIGVKPIIGIIPEGVFDEENIKILNGIHKHLGQGFFDNVGFTLIGFDPRGVTNEVNKFTNEVTEIVTNPKDSIWVKYEQIITNNYSICSNEYKDFLLKYIPNNHYDQDILKSESYKRIWYNEIQDNVLNYNILLEPLVKNKYNLLRNSYNREISKRIITPKGKYIETLNTHILPQKSKSISRAIANIAFNYKQEIMFPDKQYENNFIENLNFLL